MKKLILLIASLVVLFYAGTSTAAIQPPQLCYSTNGLEVTAFWTATSGATGYTLHHAPFPYDGPDTIGSVEMGSATTITVDLFEGAGFYIAVTAKNGQEESEYSNIDLFKTTTGATSASATLCEGSAPVVAGVATSPCQRQWDRDLDGIGDEISRTYTYDADGHLISDSFYGGQILYEYDAAGNQISSTWDYDMDGVLSLDPSSMESRKIYAYEGNISGFVALGGDFGNPYYREDNRYNNEDSTPTFQFDSNGKLQREVEVGSSGNIYKDISYNYNGSGLLISATDVNPFWPETINYTYTYNQNNKVSTMTKVSTDTEYPGYERIKTKGIYTYSENQKIIKYDGYDLNTNSIDFSRNYLYDEFGRLSTIEHHNYDFDTHSSDIFTYECQ